MKIKIADQLINKELEIVGALAMYDDIPATCETLIKDTELGNFGDKYWFEFYKFIDEDQYNEWQDYCHELIKKTYPRWSIRKINEEFKMFDLFFGLKHL